ncbi:MAG: ExbD/TolR family protein [Bdellovibrionia bacterium]
MNFLGAPKKNPKKPIELQLTALIDVFSMIVIFLVLGGAMGAADLEVPSGMQLPKSFSREQTQSAPRVVVDHESVRFSLMNEVIPLSEFRQPGALEPIISRIHQAALSYLKSQEKAKISVYALNFLADSNTPYQDVFDVVLAFRKAGFTSILFVTSSERSQGG